MFAPHLSAHAPLVRWQRWTLILTPVLLLAANFLLPNVWIVFSILIGVLCLIAGVMRYVMVFLRKPVDLAVFSGESFRGDEPIYTILVPLFKEAHMLPSLVESLRALDWPHDKLDIKIILEEADEETCKAASALGLEAPFEVVVVPDGQPRTKAKACNYALFSARGAFVAIYDAEDRPRSDQLRCAWHIFCSAPDELACLQAPLTFFNGDTNWLARQFTVEYMLQFMFFLPYLVDKKLPVFLGGSSNHFRMDVLRALYGWDAYNVTEDADIGLRLARCGYVCGILPSLTQEEAACQWGNWLRQRSRWIKGWLQTWLVAMRAPVSLLREIGWRDFLFLQFLVPVYVLALFVHLVIWPVVLVLLFVAPEQTVWILSILAITYGLIGITVHHACRQMDAIVHPKLNRQGWLVSLYWLLMGLAACRAVFHLIIKPYYWDKTRHGYASVYK